MLKFLSYSFILAFGVIAFFYFGSSIALALVGLFFVFAMMIHYLKSHTVEIEEYDYTSNLLSDKPLKFLSRSKSSNAKASGQAKETKKRAIPADPNVIAAFQRTLQDKTAAIEDVPPIAITKKRNYRPIKTTLDQRVPSKENEKVKVTISSAAKSKQKASAAPLVGGKDNAKAHTAPDQLALDKTSTNSESKISKSIAPKIIKPKTSLKSQLPSTDQPSAKKSAKLIKPQKAQLDSIFDELIEEDQTFSDEKPENTATTKFKESEKSSLNNITNPAAKAAANDTLVVASDTLKEENGVSSTSKDSITNLTSELSGPGHEVITKLQDFIAKDNFSEAFTLAKDFLNTNDIPLKKDEAAEINYLLGMAALKEDDFETARTTLMEHFSNQIAKDDPQFSAKLYKIVDMCREAKAHKFAIPFFITALSLRREAQNFHAMDELYCDIADAYYQLNEPEKLVEAYQNQLAIKRRLQDHQGQLDILDRLGKIYYDSSDHAGSSFCYQQALEIRKKILESPSA